MPEKVLIREFSQNKKLTAKAMESILKADSGNREFTPNYQTYWLKSG